MMGVPEDPKEKGLIPRLLEALFEKQRHLPDNQTAEFECSYMEIYNEKVFDLLDKAGGRHRPLNVRDSKVTGPYVDGITKVTVDCFETVSHLMDQGNTLRHVASTAMNATSSRSHAMFQITLKLKTVVSETRTTQKSSRINLVDLAGSERQKKTEASGAALKEGAAINLSLSSLGLVISELVKQLNKETKTSKKGGSPSKHQAASHIPYRDSILTWLLKENFGGNSKTAMIAAISPAADNYDETLSTLRYANRAKQIVNKAVVNECSADKLVRELKEHIADLEEKLAESIKNGGTHEEIVGLVQEKEAHEEMVRHESGQMEIKLAQTKQLLDDTKAELESNAAALKAILGKEQDVEADLSKALTQEQRLGEENMLLRAKVAELEGELGQATTDHMAYAASVAPQLSELKAELERAEAENASLKGTLSGEKNKEANAEAVYTKQLAEEEAALQAERDVETKLSDEMAKVKVAAAAAAADIQSKEASLEAENQAMQEAMKGLLEKEAIARDAATAAEAKVAPLEAHIARLKVELLQGVDKKWNAEPTGRPNMGNAGNHLIRPSSLRTTTKATVAEGDKIKAAFQVLSSDKEAELEATVKDLELELAKAKGKEAEAVRKAASLS